MAISFQDVVLWKEARISTAAFLFGFCVFLGFSFYSVLEVLTSLAIPTVIVAMTVRIIYLLKSAIFKAPPDHPFQPWLDQKWIVHNDKMYSVNCYLSSHVNTIVLETKRIVLVEDFLSTVKALLFLFLWNYIGKHFSGLTLVFFGYIGVFTVPKLYETYQEDIHRKFQQIKKKHSELHISISKHIPGMSHHVSFLQQLNEDKLQNSLKGDKIQNDKWSKSD